MEKIFITEKIHKNAITLLQQHFEVIQGNGTGEKDIISQAQGCVGILVRSAEITTAVMKGITSLKIIAKHGIGVDNIDVQAATERKILVINTPYANTNAVAEHTLAMIFVAAKRIVCMDKVTRQGDFALRNQYTNIEIKGKTVGLIGFGRISKLLAKKMSGMEVNILVYDPFLASRNEVNIHMTDLDDLLSRSDFISLHLPLTEETQKMINTEALAKMKKTAFLINTARGPIVDEQALYLALKSNNIAGAMLDVYSKEPPDKSNPLFEFNNVIFSPHNAALTEEALLAMSMDSAQGIVDYLAGLKPQYPVNTNVIK